MGPRIRYEFRNISLSDNTEATLEQLLDRRSVALLGEPGAGKSTVAHATVERVAARGYLFGLSLGPDLPRPSGPRHALSLQPSP